MTYLGSNPNTMPFVKQTVLKGMQRNTLTLVPPSPGPSLSSGSCVYLQKYSVNVLPLDVADVACYF